MLLSEVSMFLCSYQISVCFYAPIRIQCVYAPSRFLYVSMLLAEFSMFLCSYQNSVGFYAPIRIQHFYVPIRIQNVSMLLADFSMFLCSYHVRQSEFLHIVVSKCDNIPVFRQYQNISVLHYVQYSFY